MQMQMQVQRKCQCTLLTVCTHPTPLHRTPRPAGQRSIFGLFTVPAHLYPWALLVFWQLLMPQVSFLGHLAGVVVSRVY